MDFAIENNILIGLTGMSRLIYHDEKSLSSTKFHYCRRSILILNNFINRMNWAYQAIHIQR